MTEEKPSELNPMQGQNLSTDDETPPFRSLKQFIDHITGKEQWKLADVEDAGLAEVLLPISSSSWSERNETGIIDRIGKSGSWRCFVNWPPRNWKDNCGQRSC